MKKFMKNLTKAFCLLFVVTLASFSFVGCKDKNNNNNPASNTASTVVGEETNNSADNVNQDEETPEVPEVEVVELNGIYKMARPITYKDSYWTVSNEELFAFFETTDINGVYNALRKTGFLEFANGNIYEEDGTTYEYMVGFNGDTFNGLIFDGETYTIEDSFPISSITSKIEIIDEDNFFVYAPYYYAKDLQLIESPIFIKMPFTRIANSADVLTGTTYTYTANSAKIQLSNQSSMTEEDAMLAVAEIFDIPTTDIATTIEEMFAHFDVQIDADLSKVTVFDKYDNTISFATITNATGTVYGITISTTGRIVDVATGVETINFVVEIDANTIFTFEYQAV